MRHAYRTALVTGASSGIGDSFARVLAAGGSDLVVVARRTDRLERLAAALREEHRVEVQVLPADLAVDAGLTAVTQRLASGDPPVELLVNNAGLGSSGPFAKQDTVTLDAQIAVNVMALTRLARAALPGMLDRGHGGILNVSSMAGFAPGPGAAVYSATKAFVTSLSESLHAEVAGTGVHVTALCPGFTRTEFHHGGSVDVGYLPKLVWLDSGDVARAGLAAVTDGRTLAVPGAQYKVTAGAARLLPRTALAAMARLVWHP